MRYRLKSQGAKEFLCGVNDCGVYIIRFKGSGMCYIGSSVEMSKRKKTHLSMLESQRHTIKMQDCFEKYGKDSYTFQVLEYCREHRLAERESFYINLFKPELNHCKESGRYNKYNKNKKTKMTLSMHEDIVDLFNIYCKENFKHKHMVVENLIIEHLKCVGYYQN